MRRLALCVLAMLVTALALAGQAQAAATASCTAGAVTINVTGGGPDTIATSAGDTDTVVINGTPAEPCGVGMPITSIDIQGDGGANNVSYASGRPIPVTGDLGGVVGKVVNRGATCPQPEHQPDQVVIMPGRENARPDA